MPPVIAIAGAVASVVGGTAAIAAGSELVGGLMIAGGVASGLGAITGNKTLSMFGALAGVAGGVAGLASGAWDSVATSATQSSFGGSATSDSLMSDAAASDAGNGLAGAGSADTMMSDAAASDAGNGLVDSARTSDMTTADASDPMMAPDTQAMGGPPADPSAPGGTPGTPPTQAAPGASAPTADTMMSDAASSDAGNLGNSGVVGSAAAPNSSLGSFIQRVPQWIEQHKEAAKLLGGVVGGAMKSYGDQATLRDRYALQTAYEQANRQRLSDSIKGLQMPSYQPYSATK